MLKHVSIATLCMTFIAHRTIIAYDFMDPNGMAEYGNVDVVPLEGPTLIENYGYEDELEGDRSKRKFSTPQYFIFRYHRMVRNCKVIHKRCKKFLKDEL